MAKGIKPEDLGAALAEELTIYHKNVTEAVDAAGEDALSALVKKTRATAPVGARGTYKRHITGTTLKQARGNRYVWHVKSPDHRLTHLLVHGHATRDGGRTKADPFLQNALAQVLPAYEKEVKEALTNGK